MSVQKIIRGLYPGTPVSKERGGKAKGRVGLEQTEGREWAGKMKGREEEREGRIVREGWCLQTKILATPLSENYRFLIQRENRL
jgi:hypothetical protein